MAATAAKKQAVTKIIKYIGVRTTNFGRPLWEIVLNLKNFGAGRFVIRTTFYERYPEPTFYKILSVKPQSIEQLPGHMIGNVLTEVTFRGKKFPDPLDLGKIAWKDDFQLVHKHEEWLLTAGKQVRLEPPHILPRTAPLPPLWKELIRREKLNQGLSVGPDELELEMIYEHNQFSLIKIAGQGNQEEPSFKTGPGNFKTNNSPLYNDIIWNREEAMAKYKDLKPIEPTKGHKKFQLPDV